MATPAETTLTCQEKDPKNEYAILPTHDQNQNSRLEAAEKGRESCQHVMTASGTSVDPVEKQAKDSHEIHFLDEIDKLEVSDLPAELQSVNLEELKRVYKNAASFSILLTGKTGSGKSTLANGILGVKLAKVDGDPGACTQEVTSYEVKKGKINVTVWDSPGLQDGTTNQKAYVEQMKSQCRNRDLTVYCIKIDTRFVRGDDNPDVRAMKIFTEAFGEEFWSNTVIVLTFANFLEEMNEDEWEELSKNEKHKAFLGKINEWEKLIKLVMVQDIGIPKEIVEPIKVIPAGKPKKPHLPGYPFWLSALWFCCLKNLSTPEAQAVLVQLNADRVVDESAVSAKDFMRAPEDQPLVLPLFASAKLTYQKTGNVRHAFGTFLGAAILNVLNVAYRYM